MRCKLFKVTALELFYYQLELRSSESCNISATNTVVEKINTEILMNSKITI